MRLSHTLPVASGPLALTIGNFDGVHRGHQAMLARLSAKARALGVRMAVLTFEPHPREVFMPQSETELRQRLGLVLKDGRAKSMPLDEFLDTATPRQIVTRLLRNLKSVYMNANKHELALDVMHRMLLVVPEAVEELRDRGLLYARLDCFRAASGDLQNYLRRRPDAPDAIEIHGRVVELKQAAARLN